MLFIWNLNAQNYKYEHEKNVSHKKVPVKASLTLKEIIKLDKNKSWFKENNIDRISYEFKANINSNKISVEFDSLGNFEDLELDFKFEKLDIEIQKRLTKYLESNYKSYRIKSIQLQWTNQLTAMNFSDFKDYSNVEIVIKAKKNNSFGNFELLFDHLGNPISESEILDRTNSDHLDY